MINNIGNIDQRLYNLAHTSKISFIFDKREVKSLIFSISKCMQQHKSCAKLNSYLFNLNKTMFFLILPVFKSCHGHITARLDHMPPVVLQPEFPRYVCPGLLTRIKVSGIKMILLIKRVICFVALIIFCMQMFYAFVKYVENPAMFAQETTDVLNLKAMPVVTICPAPKFDYDTAKKFGYAGKTSFFEGKPMGRNDPAWSGNSGMSYEEVKKILFAEMFGNTDSLLIKDFKRKLMDPQPKDYIALPQGICKALISYDIASKSGPLVIEATEGQIMVTVTDPARELFFKTDINSMSGNKIYLEVNQSNPIHHYYMATLRETHGREGQDGCMDYGDTHKFPSYSQCAEEELRSRWLPAYGCMPPWMSKAPEDRCNASVVYNPQHKALHDEAEAIYTDSLYGFDPVFSTCLPPCLKTSVTVKNYGLYDRPHWNFSRITISFHAEVKKAVMKSAYSFTDLIIEAGSSLGLWLGLSVIGLYDIFILGVEKMMHMVSDN